MHHTLDREYSRSRKYLQLTNERLVQAELALRYWHDHDNLYIWAPIPIYTDRVDYRSLEMALIQEWQPRLNHPFICQFFHPKKGLLKKPILNTNAQFGLATLWRRAKHKFTSQLVRQVLTSSRFQNRLELWTIIHALGSNTKASFEQTKMLRSHAGGLTLCYALRRLANNTQEPFRTLSLNAIDASIKWWHGKPAPRASALRAPWSLSPNLQPHLKKFLRQWHFKMLDHQVPCHTPSFKMVFIKHAAVLDILCNHKQAIDDWSTSNPAICCCKSWSPYKSAALNPSDPHWVLSGSLLHSLLPPELAVIAEGSLSNKVFPSKKEYHNQMRLGFKTWTKRNGLPSMPQTNISDLCHHLWSEHTQQITNHITKSSINKLQSTFDGAIFHCEDKHASSLRIYCPSLYYQSIENTFRVPSTPTWQSLSLGSGLWPSTPIRLHSGKTKERISQRSTHHLLRGLPISTHAQYPCQTHLSAHSSRLSQPLCHRGRLYITFHSAISACRRRFDPGQSGFGGLLHQYWPRPICPILVHAPGLPPSKNERFRWWSFFGISRKIQQSGWHHQRTYLPSSQCHSKDCHQRCPRLDQVSTEHADFRTGPKMCPSKQRKPHGQPSLTGSLPYGSLHQWTNLV